MRLLLLILIFIWSWYKMIKPLIYSIKVPNQEVFNAKLSERDRLETKAQTKPLTTKEKIELDDLTNTLKWACYGVTSRTDIEGVCLTIATLFPSNANPQHLYQFLMEICAAETLLATKLYKINRGYGYGLFQFDKIAFEDCKALIKAKHSNEFLFICNHNIDNVKYPDLQNQALVAAFFARVYLKYRIPAAVSDNISERARQWKKYYNTELGAGTIAGYIEKVKSVGLA